MLYRVSINSDEYSEATQEGGVCGLYQVARTWKSRRKGAGGGGVWTFMKYHSELIGLISILFHNRYILDGRGPAALITSAYWVLEISPMWSRVDQSRR